MLFNICCRLPVLRSCVNGNLICQISLTVPPQTARFQHQFLAAKAHLHHAYTNGFDCEGVDTLDFDVL
ncbi:hypothetical protein AND_001516 [Anopheles darlingi]|uniref:Uncharacterized protein n=1 Tax=Anopheles darlingi TaxID=43151 RepID=W5JQK7_ANODA|nr:hypothetical protein AND_001516 [Anopheles darlingi]